MQTNAMSWENYYFLQQLQMKLVSKSLLNIYGSNDQQTETFYGTFFTTNLIKRVYTTTDRQN